MKEKLKKVLLFILNPRLLFCLGIAWMITNGWSYLAFAVGSLYEIEWLVAIATAYLAFLWVPMTPEKIVTVIIAIWLLRLLFPRDEKTLKILKNMHESFWRKYREYLARRRAKKEARRAKKNSSNKRGDEL